jgi:hypothetical protein
MVTGSGAGLLADGPVATAFGIIEVIVFASWALLFAVLIAMLVTFTLMRGRRQRRRAVAPSPGPDPRLRGLLAELRRSDPDFDEELLLEAAQMVCLVMFAALSTGDEQPIRHLAAPSFWATYYGRFLRTQAREARMQRAALQDTGGASRRRARLPVDYQASAPELIGLALGRQQRALVRVSFYELRALIAPGAQATTAMASASSLTSLATSFGGVISGGIDGVPAPSWLSSAGRYDLVFVRPGGTQTDQGASVASRTCAVCGATYRSELATTCSHCRAPRPLPWGAWRITSLTPVE